ncbi:MAG: phosphotransferase family protein [Lautropia sp.]
MDESPVDGQAQPDAGMRASLVAAGLLGAHAPADFEALAGGVSSDIWKVTTASSVFCVKRPLGKLRVAAEWHAPLARNAFEVAWMRIAHRIVPDAVPAVLHHDPQAHLCAMQYLDPQRHRLWKTELRNGHVDPRDAATVGCRLGRIHAQTADDAAVFACFPANDIFHAIRLEPYLEATALVHPDLRAPLFALSARTASIRRVMVHGDVSPKNILLGDAGPVFLDAECACIGDPAFDLAFCLNHLLLKCLWVPASRDALLASVDALALAYLSQVRWEPADALEARAASLLPGLLLARVDGRSPVEYLRDDESRDRVRRCARRLLLAPPARLAEVVQAWRDTLPRGPAE